MQPMRKHITGTVIKAKIKEGIYVFCNLPMNSQDAISTVNKYNRCWGLLGSARQRNRKFRLEQTYLEMRTCTEKKENFPLIRD